MSSECKTLPAYRIASAAGALAITSVLLLAVGLGFPARASAEASVARPVMPSIEELYERLQPSVVQIVSVQ